MAKHTLLKLTDSNMWGSHWTSTLWLEPRGRGAWILGVDLETAWDGDVPEGEEPLEIDPFGPLADGLELLEVLPQAVEAAGHSPDTVDPADLIPAIREADATLAASFAHALEERRAAPDPEVEARKRFEALAPFARRIEVFVQRFSPEKLHYPGAGRVYPSHRFWVRRFIEDYVLEHGELPSGRHAVRVQGYSGGTQDFSEL